MIPSGIQIFHCLGFRGRVFRQIKSYFSTSLGKSLCSIIKHLWFIIVIILCTRFPSYFLVLIYVRKSSRIILLQYLYKVCFEMLKKLLLLWNIQIQSFNSWIFTTDFLIYYTQPWIYSLKYCLCFKKHTLYAELYNGFQMLMVR